MRKDLKTSESSFSNPGSKRSNLESIGSHNEIFPSQPSAAGATAIGIAIATATIHTDDESMSAGAKPTMTSLSESASSGATPAYSSTSVVTGQLHAKISVEIPSFLLVGDTPYREDRIKQWIWKHHQDALFQALELNVLHDLTDPKGIKKEEHQVLPENFAEAEAAAEDCEQETTTIDVTGTRKRRRVGVSTSSSSNTTNMPLSLWKKKTPQDREHLLDTIARVQRRFFQSEAPRDVFGGLLDGLLDLMDSEYGFIGEVKYEEDGTLYLQTHAITNIAWNQATRQFYDENINFGLKFTNLKTLFGTVMTTRKPVISNNPKTDSRAGGVPEGHPPLNHFLGLPFFRNGELLGMVGISNKPGGYEESDIDFLEPLTMTCSNLIQAYQQMHQNQYLINTLEESVKARTSELERVNHNLEEANRQVRQNAMMQMQHFACMSHEIRTPLNCIIGMSSLLSDTDLDPMQKESMNMIIASGDLLLAIVNDVLDYAKLETDHVKVNIAQSDLQEMIESILYSIEMKAQGAGQTVRAFYDPYLPKFIHTDIRKIQQILFNLLGNAIKFSKENGVVEFSARYEEVPQEDDISKKSCPLDMSARSDLLDASKRSNNSDQLTSPTRAIPEDSEMECDETDTKCPYSRQVKTDGQQPASRDENEKSPTTCPFARLEQERKAKSVKRNSKNVTKDEALLIFSSQRSINGVDDGGEEPMVALETLQTGQSGNVSEANSPISEAKSKAKPVRLNSNLVFEVKDYGKGIPRESFDVIFRPFQQTPGTEVDTVYGGTGLGLTITKKLVTALGGTIKVDSELGSWSKFTVTIPCKDPPVPVDELATKMRDAVVLVVGLPKEQKENLVRVFLAFSLDVRFLNSVDEIHDFASPGTSSAIDLDKRIICLIEGKDATTEWLSVAAEWPSKWNRAISFFTFGSHLQGSSPADTMDHIRSLEQTFPVSLIEKLHKGTNRTRLPQSDGSSSAAEASTSSESKKTYSFENLRILVAEDNKVNQKVLLSMLKRLNATSVDFVENGRDAVEQESRKPYDVVLMDQQMPVMGGIPACRAICSRSTQGSHPHPQIIFVTAHVSTDFENECTRAGCSGFLPKPFKVQDIEACLRQVSETKENRAKIDSTTS